MGLLTGEWKSKGQCQPQGSVLDESQCGYLSMPKPEGAREEPLQEPRHTEGGGDS